MGPEDLVVSCEVIAIAVVVGRLSPQLDHRLQKPAVWHRHSNHPIKDVVEMGVHLLVLGFRNASLELFEHEFQEIQEEAVHFIGQIQTSEFDTFELTADVSPDTENVPIRIDYSVDGERYTQTVDVDVSGPQAASAASVGQGGEGNGPEGPDGGSGGGLPVLPIALALAVLGGLFLLYRWRRQ